jgi:hypothetical protein
MSDLKVNSKIFAYPDPGKEPNWASEVTNWAREVTIVLDSFAGLGTLTETQSVIENNISSVNAKSVLGLIFNKTLCRVATVVYRIYRKTALTSESSEDGILTLYYSEVNPLNKWSITREITNVADVNDVPTLVYFDVDNSGQVKYYSSDKLSGPGDSNYEGYIRFKTTSIIR